MTLTAASLVGATGKVICFEPNPTMYARLLHNIQINGFTNIESHNVALGAAEGEAVLYWDPKINMGGATLVETTGGKRVAEVKIVSLDHTLQDAAIHLIKIDVEGFEANVIQGALETIKHSRPIFILEFIRTMPTPDQNPFAAYETLMSLDYKCYKLSEGKFSQSSSLVLVNGRADLPDNDNIVFLPG